MTAFANFLFINGIPKTEIAKFLGVSNGFVTRLCNGEKNLPEEQRVKILNSGKGWDTSPLEKSYNIQTIGDHSPFSSNTNGDCELWKKLCEEKDKRIAILEEYISLLKSNDAK